MKKLLNLIGTQQLSKNELLSINGGSATCADSEGICETIACYCEAKCRPSSCDR